MAETVLFYMWEPFRQQLIESHRFYVKQAQTRLLDQFDNLEEEADRYSEKWLEEKSHLFDPDRHDPSDFYERAHDADIEHYLLLCDMRERIFLSVISGVYHEWDKQLRDWITQEFRHWHTGDNLKMTVWKANFDEIIELLEGCEFSIKDKDFFSVLNQCRLIVNVYKHGDGNSFNDLLERNPEYFDSGLKSMLGDNAIKFLNHTHLSVPSHYLDELSNAIIAFWQSIPERVFLSEKTTFPKWFEKALQKDMNTNKKVTQS